MNRRSIWRGVCGGAWWCVVSPVCVGGGIYADGI